MKKVKATISFDVLPGNAVITGKATRSEESSWPQVQGPKKVIVLAFHCKTVNAIRAALKNKRVDRIEIEEITWKK